MRFSKEDREARITIDPSFRDFDVRDLPEVEQESFRNIMKEVEREMTNTSLEYLYEGEGAERKRGGPLEQFSDEFSKKGLQMYEAYIYMQRKLGIEEVPGIEVGYFKRAGLSHKEVIGLKRVSESAGYSDLEGAVDSFIDNPTSNLNAPISSDELWKVLIDKGSREKFEKDRGADYEKMQDLVLMYDQLPDQNKKLLSKAVNIRGMSASDVIKNIHGLKRGHVPTERDRGMSEDERARVEKRLANRGVDIRKSVEQCRERQAEVREKRERIEVSSDRETPISEEPGSLRSVTPGPEPETPGMQRAREFREEAEKIAKNTGQSLAEHRPAAYGSRDVRTLKGLSDWSVEDERVQFAENRMLQSGFLSRDAREVVADAKLLKEDWLTDIVCPSVKSFSMLHVGKELVVNYNVSEDDFDKVNHQVQEAMLRKEPGLLDRLEDETNSKLAEMQKEGGDLSPDKLRAEARKRLGAKKIPETGASIAAAERLIIDAERKKLSGEFVSSHVSTFLSNEQNRSDLNLTPKPDHPVGQTTDYALLGAPGSGKSTMARLKLTENDKDNSVTFATDVYRAFTLPGTDAHEARSSRDVFTRTQDVAYMVKELVGKEIQGQIDKGSRPNIIFDGVRLEEPAKSFLKNSGKLTTMVAAYGGVGYVGIAERADHRARDEYAPPADKGRFIDTTALLGQHAAGSKYLLAGLPDKCKTSIYNTDVERGATPPVIAEVDTTGANKIVDVKDLGAFSGFLNKQNINVEAEHPVELLLQKQQAGVISRPEKKAETMLDFASQNSEYTFKLRNANGEAYATLKKDTETGKVKLNVINQDVLSVEVAKQEHGARILRAVIDSDKVVSERDLGTLKKQIRKIREAEIKSSPMHQATHKLMGQMIKESEKKSAVEGQRPTTGAGVARSMQKGRGSGRQ